ncbi:glycosyltransferase [Mycoplasmatota bacterium]|nr:glycosyltransferase [Mycoplasmatota bacterium]
MKLTVGQFNDSYPPVMDGVGNTVKNYAYWINKKYGESYVITPKFPRYTDNEDFQVIRYASTHLPRRKPYRLGIPSIAFDSKRKLNQIDFDILHVHCPFSSGQLALKLAQKKQIPIVASFHSKFYDDFKQALKNDFLAKLAVKRIVSFYEKVDYVWTVNESTAETLKSYGFNKKIEIMPNGTDFKANIDINENKKYMNELYHIQNNELVFLFVGQHIWQKNIKLIVEALKQLKQSNLPFKMFFIGEGYAKNDLMSLVNQYSLTNHVQFMGKITNRELLKRFFARADLFIFPSVYDNAPIVVREAAALNTPSIVIDGSNAQEGIIDGVNGFTCLENVTSLANKINLISQDKDKLKEIGNNAKETVARSWESIVDQVAEKYQDIIYSYQMNK